MDIFKAATGTTTKSHLNNLKILSENLFQRASILVNTQLSRRILSELSEEKTVEPSCATVCLHAFSVTDRLSAPAVIESITEMLRIR